MRFEEAVAKLADDHGVTDLVMTVVQTESGLPLGTDPAARMRVRTVVAMRSNATEQSKDTLARKMENLLIKWLRRNGVIK